MIGDQEDYEWSKKIMAQFDLTKKCEILFSPVYQQLNNQTLADWILIDQLPVRFQIQLHKIIWGDAPGK